MNKTSLVTYLYIYIILPAYTRHTKTMLVRWASVIDDGPTLTLLMREILMPKDFAPEFKN